MPLRIEVYKNGKWIKVGELTKHDPPGSFSNISPDGRREIYIFECFGNKSVIYRSKGGIDREIGSLREIYTFGLERIKELGKGNSYEMEIGTDKSSERRKIRFVHV